jgi:hypothetical protein
MKASTILFTNLLSSLASIAAGLPAEHAPDAIVSPRDIVYLSIWREHDYGGKVESLELSTDSCRKLAFMVFAVLLCDPTDESILSLDNLGNGWRNAVGSAYSATLCYYYG